LNNYEDNEEKDIDRLTYFLPECIGSGIEKPLAINDNGQLFEEWLELSVPFYSFLILYFYY